MQHIEELFSGTNARHPPTVWYYQHDETCRFQPDRTPLTCEEFVTFPRSHGFYIKSDYSLIRSSPSPISNSIAHTIDAGASSPVVLCTCDCGKQDELANLYQCWLFFQLIRCFLGLAKKVQNLDSAKLTQDRGLTTKRLPKALQKWSESIENDYRQDPEEVRRQLVELAHVLQLAKRVVHRKFAGESEESLRGEPRSWPVTRKNEELQGLTFMAVGEILCATLQRVIKTCGIQHMDWMDVDIGWGPSPWTSRQMRDEGWCPRARKILEGQFSRNATLLLAAYCVNGITNRDEYVKHPGSFRGRPRPCDSKTCHFIEAQSNMQGATDHSYDHTHAIGCNEPNCNFLRPPEQRILDILAPSANATEEPSFPLLCITKDNSGELQLTVENWRKSRPSEYITISHVWSQGLGNQIEMALRECHLRELFHYFEKLEKLCPRGHPNGPAKHSPSYLFWIDTLAIPNTRDSDDLALLAHRRSANKKALDLIYDVYDKAAECIIIDRSLSIMDGPHSDETIAMRLISGAWMSRLWTLQEAYVSKKLFVALRGDIEQGVRSLESLWVPKNPTFMKHLWTRMLQHSVSQNLMTEKSDGMFHISRAWRAARYREGLNEVNLETFALASILDITVPDDIESGSTPLEPEKRPIQLMEGFWKKISEQSAKQPKNPPMNQPKDHLKNHPIPAGLIFLPGKRLPSAGFGWAPRTWMSFQDEPYPFPLSFKSLARLLDSQGLLVRFPGFRLDTSEAKAERIIARPNFVFSVGKDLNECYKVRPAKEADDELSSQGYYTQVKDILLARFGRSIYRPKIGLILSRTRPGEAPGEIGLLVEIVDDTSIRETPEGPINNEGPLKNEDPPNKPALGCKIIRRVEVSRIATEAIKDLPQPSGTQSFREADPVVSRISMLLRDGIIAHSYEDRQVWCVDGYSDSEREADLKPPPIGQATVPQKSFTFKSAFSHISTLMSERWGAQTGVQDSEVQNPLRAATMPLEGTRGEAQRAREGRKSAKQSAFTFTRP